MRNVFKQSEEFLDLETMIKNEEKRMKETIGTQIATTTTEQLSHVQELLNHWKTVEAINKLSQEMKQKDSPTTTAAAGSMLVFCPQKNYRQKQSVNSCNKPWPSVHIRTKTLPFKQIDFG